MDAAAFVERLSQSRFYDGQIAHVRHLPERPPVYADVPGGLEPAVAAALERQGIAHLYSHQAEAIHRIREGQNVVVVTGTASGKTLCYNIPVVETLLHDPLATMLYLYPTKALAQDQLRGLGALQDASGSRPSKTRRCAAQSVEDLGPGSEVLWAGGVGFLAGTYDGDTPSALRRKLRDSGNVILTNPDMLHQGILPQHPRWSRFFSHLRYVVIDEVHAYRGVFGSHLANVLRRLWRICRHYGAAPQFICCSATIANPKEHAERITGCPVALVDNDGSPRGPRVFVLWNPPPLDTAARGQADAWRVGGDRRSPLWEAVHLMTCLVQEGVQTIAFVRTRLAAELLFKNCRDQLRPVSPRLANAVHAYRGGYLPQERREIERRLVEKEILGVASTNALELGIDIGSLDACLLVGYPGTIASLWQQVGRAGRGREESLAIFIAQNTPIDQYLTAHPDYLFAKSPEQAVVDPDNPHIVAGHLKCAAQELPVGNDETPLFGPYADSLLELLQEEGSVRQIHDRWYWARSEYPAASVSLRNIGGAIYTIQDEADGCRVIGTMDEVSAFAQLHDHAVYLHGAETYLVTKLDIEQKIAHVQRQPLDYYTQSIQVSQIRIDEALQRREWRRAELGFGDVTVTTSVPMFRKMRFHSRDSIGFERLELPPQELETVALWFTPPQWLVQRMQEEASRHDPQPGEPRWSVGEALIGIANVLVEVAPLFVMCDTQDIGSVVDSSCLGRDALFLYDRYPGGMGYARRCLDCLPDMLERAATIIRECRCTDGCPSCVGAAIPPFAMTDLDASVRGRIPDKAAARFLLDALLSAAF